MRRRNRRQFFNEERETKTLVIISLSVLIIAVVAFIITFLPLDIFSSSPKLNLRIKTPVAIATPAAGAANLTKYDCILFKAEFSLLTRVGVLALAQYTVEQTKNIQQTIKHIIIIFL